MFFNCNHDLLLEMKLSFISWSFSKHKTRGPFSGHTSQSHSLCLTAALDDLWRCLSHNSTTMDRNLTLHWTRQQETLKHFVINSCVDLICWLSAIVYISMTWELRSLRLPDIHLQLALKWEKSSKSFIHFKWKSIKNELLWSSHRSHYSIRATSVLGKLSNAVLGSASQVLNGRDVTFVPTWINDPHFVLKYPLCELRQSLWGNGSGELWVNSRSEQNTQTCNHTQN